MVLDIDVDFSLRLVALDFSLRLKWRLVSQLELYFYLLLGPMSRLIRIVVFAVLSSSDHRRLN